MENPRLEFEIEMNNKLSILQTYKDALENMVQIGGLWAVGQDKIIYHIEMPDKIHDTMWKHAKRYDIQTGEVIGYTNADRIRKWSDEEIAEFTIGVADGVFELFTGAKMPDEKRRVMKAEWLDWLKQEAQCTSE